MLHMQGVTGNASSCAAVNSDMATVAANESGRLGGHRAKTFDEMALAMNHCGAVFPEANRFDGEFKNFIDRRARAELALSESRRELRRLSGLLCSMQEDERRRIARDLHDGLGQSLNLIKMSLENTVRIAPAESNATVVESLLQVIPRIKDALSEVRRVAKELRPPMLDDLGILPTLGWLLRDYETTCVQIRIEKVFAIEESDVPDRLKITLFRIIQEAINNIVKHAGANRVRIQLERHEDVLHLLIEDNGCGFDPAKVVCTDAHGRGLGLLSMKERAAFSGGVYRLESTSGQGTRIRATWPCGEDVAAANSTESLGCARGAEG